MAKKQTFESKLRKTPEAQTKAVKLIFSYQAADTGTWRFAEKIVKVPLEGDEFKVVEEARKAGLEYLNNQTA